MSQLRISELLNHRTITKQLRMSLRELAATCFRYGEKVALRNVILQYL